jgi:hypothetical protein
MADQGYKFGNLLNNPIAYDWNNAPDVGFKGGNFQSFLQQPEAPLTEAQGMSQLYGGLRNLMDQQVYAQSAPGMREQLEMGKEMAKEQAKQTLKFQTLANLPGQIERSFAADKYYQGMSQIPEIYRGTFASVPSMNIQAPGYSAAQVRYFS